MTAESAAQGDVDGLLNALCRHAADLLDKTDRPVRLRMRVQGASLELDWRQPDPPPQGERPVWREGIATGEVQREVGPAQESGFLVKAPLVGTFYRCPEPGKPPFVAVGDVVAAGQRIAIVEAMKLMNVVTATLPGRVAEIFVADGEGVEFDQPLYRLIPMDE